MSLATKQTAAKYLPILDHGVTGDMRTVALVSADGTIDWYCPGSFDSPSVFAAILDADRGGHYRIAAAGDCSAKQLSVPDTNVLITRFLSSEGVGELQDFMPVGGDQQLVRRVVCVRGRVAFGLECQPRFNYGRDVHSTAITRDAATFRSPSLSLTLQAPVPLRRSGAGVAAEFELSGGASATFVLFDSELNLERLSERRSEALLSETIAYWQPERSCRADAAASPSPRQTVPGRCRRSAGSTGAPRPPRSRRSTISPITEDQAPARIGNGAAHQLAGFPAIFPLT